MPKQRYLNIDGVDYPKATLNDPGPVYEIHPIWNTRRAEHTIYIEAVGFPREIPKRWANGYVEVSSPERRYEKCILVSGRWDKYRAFFEFRVMEGKVHVQ